MWKRNLYLGKIVQRGTNLNVHSAHYHVHETHVTLSLLCFMMCFMWTVILEVASGWQIRNQLFAKNRISESRHWVDSSFWLGTSFCLSRNLNSSNQTVPSLVELLAPAASNVCSWLTAEELNTVTCCCRSSTSRLSVLSIVRFFSPHHTCKKVVIWAISYQSDNYLPASLVRRPCWLFSVLAAFRAKSPGTVKSEISQPVSHQQSHLDQSLWDNFSPFWCVMRT